MPYSREDRKKAMQFLCDHAVGEPKVDKEGGGRVVFRIQPDEERQLSTSIIHAFTSHSGAHVARDEEKDGLVLTKRYLTPAALDVWRKEVTPLAQQKA